MEKQDTSTFDNWLNDLEEAPQPTCNIDNPEDCEACGSQCMSVSNDLVWCELLPKPCDCKGPYSNSKGGCKGGHSSRDQGKNVKGYDRKQ